MFKIVVTAIFIIYAGFALAANFSNCESCHHVEKIDANHNFKCAKCHLLPKDRAVVSSHKKIIGNPSSLRYVATLCGKCHKSDIENLKNSLHGSLAGAIAVTRYIWGAQNSLKPIYGITSAKGLKKLPEKYTISGAKPSEFVDDFLRRKCLRCHLYNNGTDNGIGDTGLYRGTGCAACHMKFGKFGKYGGADTLMNDKTVYSQTHTFVKVPPMNSCLSCHNTEFVGTDYIGLFPHDYAYSFNSPILPNGNFPDKLYGNRFHHLTSDIHYKAGMSCVDCHRKTDVMGDGRFYGSETDIKAIKVRCSSCHGGINKAPGQNWVKPKSSGIYYRTVDGKTLKVKLFDKTITAHSRFHKKLACSACHSAWQSENYGLNVFRSDTANYAMWKNLTTEDPYLDNFLTKAIHNKTVAQKQPEMPDRITGKLYRGVWYSGWIMRRWNYFRLGMTKNGRIKIVRPLFEYRLTYKDSKDNLIIDSTDQENGKLMNGFVPYDPHTTALYGKSCQACHENRYILNRKRLVKDKTVMRLLYGDIIHGRNLPKEVAKRLQSNFYRKTAAKMFYKHGQRKR